MRKMILRNGWGIWNEVAKEFQFGLFAEKKEQVEKGLFSTIGKDAYKYRFVARRMDNESLVNLHNKTQIKKQKLKILQAENQVAYLKRELEEFAQDVQKG